MWHPIEKAPVDEFVLLADSGGYVSQAIYGEDEENPRWRLANGQYLHANFEPLAWMPMPEYSGSPPLQDIYDEVNALGGRSDQDNSYDQGIVDTVNKVLEIIERKQGKLA